MFPQSGNIAYKSNYLTLESKQKKHSSNQLMKKRIINWGIIGAGHIAGKFADDIKLVADAQLIAIASTDLSRAKTFAEKHSISNFYGNYNAILDCPNLDAVYIATTNEQHCSNTLMCLERGIAVLCEKPFALNKKEVQMMIDKAQEKKVFLMEAMWTCFVPGFKKALAVIQSGELGAPLLVKADWCTFFPFDAHKRIYNKAMGGGALLDIGVYPVALAQAVLGKYKTIQVSYELNKITGVDDTCIIQTKYDSGAIAVLSSSVKAKLPVEAFICCEKGYVHLPARFHHPKKFVIGVYDGRNPTIERTVNAPFKGHGYRFQVEEVNRCLQQGKLQSDIVSHAFSIDVIETMDASRKEMGLVYEAD